MDQASTTSAYILAIITMAVCFGLAVLIAGMINFKPNNPGTTKRRIWFWVLCFASAAIGFLINFIIGCKIEVPTLRNEFFTAAGIAAGICLVGYIIIGFAVSRIFPSSKVGTWF